MSRQQHGNGGGNEVARGAGYAAFLGAGLIAVAVVIGIVLLQIGDKNDNGPASAARPNASTTTTTRPKTTTTRPNPPTKTTPERPPNAVSLIVLNGGAASGKAGDMDAFLKKNHGYTNQGVPTDWPGHRQTGSSVYCRAGLDREGAKLAALVGSGVQLIIPYPSPGPPSSASHDCVVVVGAAT
jgi:LytR cell envelope-related transcriptional attenuator